MKETPFTKAEEIEIGEKLGRNLGPEYLSTRAGPSGRLTYIEGKTAINIANEIFGFNGWSSDIKETVVDFVDVTENGRVNIGISVTIRITLKDGTYHEDIGYGATENARSKAAAYEKARKQAVTDATKRALRNFGNALGNCLYDKTYVNNIGKMGSPQVKFTPQNLYRHIQFDSKRKEREEIEENRNKQRKLSEQHRHEQQITMQSQKLLQAASSSSLVSKPASIEKVNTPLKTTIVKDEPKSNATVEPNIKAEFIPPLLMPEDSFSYEGDEEFFVQMLANNDFEPEIGASFESQDEANLVIQS